MSEKTLRPEWTTVVSPSEYDIDGQMKRTLQLANRNKETSVDIDLGMLWGLYESWRDARTLLHTLALGISLGDGCPFCGSAGNHKEYCGLDEWAKENTVFSKGG